MKYFIILIYMTANCSHVLSQHYMDNWYFGNYASLNFSSGSPIFQYSPMRGFEANACVSDSLGNLLFYTNGIRIWDRENNVMLNGDSLEIAQQSDYGSSVTQGVIILPVPGSPEKYYIFYLAKGNDPGDIYNLLSLMYSVVDMSLNGGSGDIIEGQKNLPVPGSNNYIWEKMSAVKHANGKDWWLITTSGRTVDEDTTYFEKFLITEEGISDPTFQPYDFWSTDGYDGWVYHGQMKFSLSGNKLAVTRTSHIDIYEFNRCDGMLSQRLIIDSLPLVSYGLEFSSDETKLYVSSWGGNPLKPHLTQICLDCNVVIKTTLFIGTKMYQFAQLQIAPDGRIYTGIAEDFFEVDGRYLSVINYPDSFGVACDFDTALVALGDTANLLLGLPNFVNYDLAALTTPCDTADTTGIADADLHQHDMFGIFPNPANTFITFSSHLNNYSNTTAEIYNAAGIKVKEIKIVSSAQKINIENFTSGIYFFSVKQNEEIIFSESFVKE